MITEILNKNVFANSTLEEVVNLAKQKGYKVYTFKAKHSIDKSIKQIFFENQEGKIGSASEYFSGITFGTVHKPCIECGTGFRVSEEFANPENLNVAFIHAPNWATEREYKAVKKYNNWEEYLEKNTILEYYEL